MGVLESLKALLTSFMMIVENVGRSVGWMFTGGFEKRCWLRIGSQMVLALRLGKQEAKRIIARLYRARNVKAVRLSEGGFFSKGWIENLSPYAFTAS